MNKIILVSLALLCMSVFSFAQEKLKEIPELKLNLNEDGSHYIKATFLNQVWLRYNESNPGTLVLNQPSICLLSVWSKQFQLFISNIG
jgi:hypothetical protein